MLKQKCLSNYSARTELCSPREMEFSSVILISPFLWTCLIMRGRIIEGKEFRQFKASTF